MRGCLDRACWAAAIVCLLSWPGLGHADTGGEAASYSEQIAEAIAEFDAGRLVEARALFLRAHAMQPSARTLRGLGMVAYGLRHYAEASHLLSTALDDARNPLTDEQRRQAKWLTRQCSVFIGRYRVVRNPPNASVTVDGAPATSLEPDLLLDAGEHTLVVQAPGYRAQERHIDVKGGETETLRFELTQNVVHDEPLPVPAHEAVVAAAPPVAEHAHDDDHGTSPWARRSTWGWVSLGVAGAALAGGVVAWRVGESASERWNDDARCLANGKTREQNCGADSDTAKVARTWTAAGLVTAGVLGVVAGVLLWPRHDDQDSGARATATCGVGPGELGVACRLGF